MVRTNCAQTGHPEHAKTGDPLRGITGGRVGIDDVQRALQLKELIEKVQAILATLCSGDADTLVQLRVGTVVTFSLLQRISAGKTPRDFSVEDWASIAHEIEDYAVNVNGQAYTAFVFGAYAAYIDTSADKLGAYVPDDRCAAIHALADELRKRTCALENGELRETAYVEDCLWISLEAMVKLLSAAAFSRFGTADELLASLADYGVAYGRLTLYRKEQAILQDILDSQGVLDEELCRRYDAYVAELNAQSEQFQLLVRNAFEVDVRSALKASAELAHAVGVPKEEVLETVDDIDRFFLG